MEEYVVRLEGKDLTSVTGSVKGILQNYVRNMHKYENAEIGIHRREGTIGVKNVPRNVIEDGLRTAQHKLLPEKRFTFTIEAPENVRIPEELPEAADSRVVARYEQMLEIERKQHEEQIAGYEGEIRRLTGEAEAAQRKMATLVELRKQDQDQLVSLKKSYDELSRLLERVTGERARSPLDMADAWVGDWSASARQMEQKIAETAAAEWPSVEPLLKFDLAALRDAVKSDTGAETVPRSVEELERLADAAPWAETEEHGRLAPPYAKAKAERDYIEALEAGTVPMPEALKETLLKAVDRASLDAAIRAYEDAEAAHSQRTAASNRIMQFVERYRRAESLRSFLAGRGQQVPVAAVCRSTEDGYRVELVLPRSDGTTLRAALEQIARKAVNEAAERGSETAVEEAVVRVGARMSGKYKEWKDVSRQQEEACLVLSKAFRDSPLRSLGLRLNVIRVMEGPSA